MDPLREDLDLALRDHEKRAAVLPLDQQVTAERHPLGSEPPLHLCQQ